MKIQKRFIRTYKGRDYYKHMVNIPEVSLTASGLKADDEFEIEVKKNEIILRKKNKT